jgi:hypothetical protein
VHPVRVVEAFDVLEDREPSFPSRFVVAVADPFGLQREEEALRCGVVEALSRPAHAADDTKFIEPILIGPRAVLTAPIRVMDESRPRSSLLDRHLECFEGDVSFRAFRSRPPDDLSRVHVHQHWEVEPAFTGSDLRDVAHPDSIPFGCDELPFRKIRRRRILASRRRDPVELFHATGLEALLSHDSGDSVAAPRLATLLQLSVHAWRSVDPPRVSVDDGVHLLGDHFVFSDATIRQTPKPRIEPTAGDLQDFAHLAYPEGLPVLLDESELHFWPSAK